MPGTKLNIDRCDDINECTDIDETPYPCWQAPNGVAENGAPAFSICDNTPGK